MTRSFMIDMLVHRYRSEILELATDNPQHFDDGLASEDPEAFATQLSSAFKTALETKDLNSLRALYDEYTRD